MSTPETEVVTDSTELAEQSVTPLQTVQTNAAVSPLAAMLSSGQHDVNAIERLFEIQKQWEAGEAKKAFFEAMANIRTELPMIIKNKANENKGNYANLDAMIAGVGPIAGKHGVSVTFKYDQTTKEGWVNGICIATHEAGHSDETSAMMPIPPSIVSKAGKQVTNDCQNTGIAMTYAQRRAFAALFSIATGDDTDAQFYNQQSDPIVEMIDTVDMVDLQAVCEDVGKDFRRWMNWISASYPGSTEELLAMPKDHKAKAIAQLKKAAK